MKKKRTMCFLHFISDYYFEIANDNSLNRNKTRFKKTSLFKQKMNSSI